MTLPTDFLLHVAGLLERLGIPYHVGGSAASSAHGMYRASADVDFVIDPTRDQLDSLARLLEPDFYVSRSAMDEALSTRRSFNAIHEATSFKIDFFVKGSTPFDDEELRRSVRLDVSEAPGRSVMLKSAEDTILRKLEWFRRGGESSDRQWHDVVSVLAASREHLDGNYLGHWAAELGVTDLLERAQREARGL